MNELHPHRLFSTGLRYLRVLSFLRWSFQIAVLAALAVLPAASQDAGSQIKSEVERLQQSLKDKPIIFPDFPKATDHINNSLNAALAAQSAGKIYISLESLGQAEDLLEGVRAAMDKADAVKNSLPAYEAEWNKASLNLTALDRKARERDWKDSRAAIRALSEVAQGKAIPLLEGGRGFAVSTQPKDGLFYLGQAQGETEFAAFCASLDVPRRSAAYPLRSYLPELVALQKKTNAAFQPPRSIELHSRFIALNSALKLGQELDASKFYAGALYQYLEAVRHYGMLDAAPLDTSQQSALKGALAAAKRKVDASKRDDSIAQLLLERAESQISRADGSAPNEDDWKSAKVIVEQVLPAYDAAAKPPAALAQTSGKTVNLTLVRWPYT
jgi:hypothetical protein